MVLEIAYYLALGFNRDIDTTGCSVIIIFDYVFWSPPLKDGSPSRGFFFSVSDFYLLLFAAMFYPQ